MNKTIILILILTLVLVSGCIQKDETGMFCSLVRNTLDENSTTKVSFDGQVCVIEDKDYTDVFVILCKTSFQRFHLILKADNQTNLTMIDTFRKKCDVIKG